MPARFYRGRNIGTRGFLTIFTPGVATAASRPGRLFRISVLACIQSRAHQQADGVCTLSAYLRIVLIKFGVGIGIGPDLVPVLFLRFFLTSNRTCPKHTRFLWRPIPMPTPMPIPTPIGRDHIRYDLILALKGSALSATHGRGSVGAVRPANLHAPWRSAQRNEALSRG